MTFQTFDSFKSLKYFCKTFDRQYQCKTTFTSMTLNEIRTLIKRPYEHDYVTGLVETMFKDKTTVLSNDYSVPESPIGKLNSFYLINQDLTHFKRFYSAVCISLFDDDYVLHPGSTRLLYSEIYHDPIDVMITDYSQNPRTFIPTKILYDSANTVLHYGNSQDLLDQHVPKKFRERDVHFKQLVDSKVDQNLFSYHKPREIFPPRIFKIEQGEITVNSLVILRYSKKQWRLVL